MPELTYDEQDRFAQELTSFARSGVPLPAGLRRLAESSQSGRLRELSSQVARDLEDGKPLSRALRDSDLLVSPQLVALIECGEISGEMTPILEFALEQSRKIKAHRAAVATTLVYPFLVLITLILVVWFMLIFIVPKFVEIYDQLGAELPMQSLWIIEIGRFFHGGVASFVFLGLIIFLLLCILLEPLRDRVYSFIAHLPGFSRLIILSDTALFTKFIERMGTRRVPLPTILNAASLAMWHAGMRNSLEEMSAAAEQGQRISGLLHAGVPATASWLLAQAEEQGNLPEVCGGISNYCSDRFERLSKRSIAVLEPVLILIVAVVVAYVIGSLYLPLFNIPRVLGGMGD